MVETIFQQPLFKEFILPFLLSFILVFALLEKTKILGENKKILNAVIAFVAGITLVTAIFPKEVITNLILFLTISMIVVFIVMGLWTFIVEDDSSFKSSKVIKWFLIIGVGIGLLFLIIWTLRVQTGLLDWISDREWASPFWTNLIFIFVVVIALVLSNGFF
ncbi:MAG: hypothetical protein P8X70_02495 [Nanoarchaeota archaeon]